MKKESVGLFLVEVKIHLSPSLQRFGVKKKKYSFQKWIIQENKSAGIVQNSFYLLSPNNKIEYLPKK